MAQVSDFVQVRADGNVVPASMTVKEMLALGWGPCKVIALRWIHDGKAVEVAAPHGVHGIVVPGGNFVAAILNEDESGAISLLTVLWPDGSVHGKLENRLRHAGLEVDGRYGWFESAMTLSTDTFGAVFQAADEGTFRCDIDARALRLSGAARIR